MIPPCHKISVVIPLYNGERFIRHALAGVACQTMPPHEVIVVDDGSVDEGPAIVENLSRTQPITQLRKINGGQSSARNFGIAHATGDLIALLDQDDVWYPNHLHELLQPFTIEQPIALGWTYSNLDEIDEAGRLIKRSILTDADSVHPKVDLQDCLRHDMFVLPSASMIARRAFDAVGGFDERLAGYEDDDLFVRLFSAGYQNIYIEKALSQWRVYPTSTSYSPRMARSRMVYARKLIEHFPNDTKLTRNYVRDLIAPRFVRQAVVEAKNALAANDMAWIDRSFDDLAFLEDFLGIDRFAHLTQRKPIITAIIPLFNGDEFIEEAIQSIFNQTLRPDEIIVVDDGSTDGGAETVARMARTNPIRLLSKPNGGQSSARNFGVEYAHGDLIALLDQDDIWYANHLEELVKPHLQGRVTELGWSYSNLDEINRKGELICRGCLGTVKAKHPKLDIASCLSGDMFVLPSASLVSRHAFLAVGGFDERLSGYEDDDLFLRLFQAGYENVYLPKSLSKWRIYQTSSSYTPRMAISRMLYARKLIDRFPDDPDMSRYYVRDMIAPRFFFIMVAELRKAVLKGTLDQQTVAVNNLAYITSYMRLRWRLPLQLLFLPSVRIPFLARFIVRHRMVLGSVARRFL
jgi:glycosyltransferase involved in cell wall biosynthesis